MSLTCHDVRQRLTEHALGVLDEADARLVDRHLEWCAGCRKEFSQLQEGAAALAFALPRDTPSPAVEERVVARLAMKAEAGHAQEGASTARHRGRIRVLAVATLAAALVAVGSLGWGIAQRDQATDAQRQLTEQRLKQDRLRTLIDDLNRRFQGTTTSFEADILPGTGRQIAGTALFVSSPLDNDFVFVQIVAPLESRSGPYSFRLLGGGGNVVLSGRLVKTPDGGLAFDRFVAEDLSHLESVVVVNGRGQSVMRGAVRPFPQNVRSR